MPSKRKRECIEGEGGKREGRRKGRRKDIHQVHHNTVHTSKAKLNSLSIPNLKNDFFFSTVNSGIHAC
jgi:hypothetical protein